MRAGDQEALLAAVADTSRDPFLVLEPDQSVHFANHACCRLFQVAAGDVAGRPLAELAGGEWRDGPLERAVSQVLAGGEPVEDLEVERGFPRIGARTLRVNVRPLRGHGGLTDMALVAMEDVTGRQALERELAARHEFTEKLVDSLRESVLVLSPDLRVESANAPFYELFRVTPGETLGRPVYDLGNGQWRIPELRRLLEDILPGQRSFDDYVVEHDFEGIGWRRMSLNARRLDHLNLVLLAVRDLTDNALAARALAREEERLQLAVEAAELGVFEWDALADRPAWLNEHMYAILGRHPERGPVTLAELTAGFLDPGDLEAFQAALAAACPQDPGFRFEGRIRREDDGARRWVGYNARLEFDPHGRPRRMVGVLADITDRKEAEAALQRGAEELERQVAERTRSLREAGDRRREAEARARHHLEEAAWLQRLNTANETAAVVAHEVNQPLASLSLHAEAARTLLGREPMDRERLAANLERLVEHAQRAGEIIRQLRRLVRREAPEPEPLDLNQVVRTTCDLFAPRLRRQGGVITLSLGADLPAVSAVALQVEQVLLNLLANAAEAMADAGVTGPWVEVATRRHQGHVRLSVRDCGPGVAEDAAEGLFQGFTGTKEYGLGMGLRISRRLVEDQGGRIWAEPDPGGGVFHVELVVAP